MRRFGATPALGIVMALALAGPALAQQPLKLKFATLSQGTSWYQYGATMAEMLAKTMPAGTTIDVLPHSGGIGNAKLVAKGEAQIAFGFSATNRWAFEKKEPYQADPGTDRLRAVAGGLDIYWLAVIASKKLPITSLADVKEKKIPVKLDTLQVGSLGEFGARQLLAAYGIKYDEIKAWGGKVSHTTYKIMVDKIRDGQSDMIIAVVNPGHPSITEIATFGDVKFLPVTDKVLDELAKAGYEKTAMPANTFRGQEQAVPYGAITTVVIARDDLPADAAYTIARTLADNKEALGQANAALKLFKPEEAWRPAKVGWIPLHPGAERFYREKGWMK
jgi:TRAP transporter TAXI family solute receptor